MLQNKLLSIIFFLVVLSLSAPLLTPAVTWGQTETPVEDDFDLEDYGEEATVTIPDPLEKWNRFWFRFNDIFILYVAKPVYRGWEYITPHQLRTGLKNFFHNILFPVRFVNNLLQLRFLEAGVEFSRFMANTITSAGFADVTKHKKTIVPVDPSGEDFGQTLGRWGVGHGCYIVWPLVGPSSVRDTVGRIGDMFADPFFYVSPWYLATATEGGLRLNDFDSVISTYDELKGAAVDPYISMRDAYINFRKIQVDR